MDALKVIVLVVCMFGIGFCVGRIWNLRIMLKELSELQAGLDRVRESSKKLDDARIRQIEELRAENDKLTRLLATYWLGGNAAVDESSRTTMDGE